MKLNVNPERMRYQKNSMSFWLCILAILCNVISLIAVYESVGIRPDPLIGLDVIINIIVLLGLFLAAERTKVYRMFWGRAVFVFAGVQFARIFFVPLVFFLRGEYETANFIVSLVSLAAASASLVLAGYVCIVRSRVLTAYIRSLNE